LTIVRSSGGVLRRQRSKTCRHFGMCRPGEEDALERQRPKVRQASPQPGWRSLCLRHREPVSSVLRPLPPCDVDLRPAHAGDPHRQPGGRSPVRLLTRGVRREDLERPLHRGGVPRPAPRSLHPVRRAGRLGAVAQKLPPAPQEGRDHPRRSSRTIAATGSVSCEEGRRSASGPASWAASCRSSPTRAGAAPASRPNSRSR